MARFAGHPGVHGTHGDPEQEPGSLKWGIKRTARTLREPVTEDLWDKHLAGKRPLGIVPIREDNMCVWGSIDVDQYNIDLLKLVAGVERMKLPLVPCRSKSGGLHLFLFLQEPEAASIVQAALRDMAAQLGLAGCEIFPKQTAILSERGDFGTWMVMPYFGGDFGGKLRAQAGLKKTGGEMTVAEFLSASRSALTRTDDLPRFTAPRSRSRRTRTGEAAPVADFEDGPPCLQHMAAAGFPEGGRNNSLFMIGLYFQRRDPATWEDRVEEANRTYMSPALTSDEVGQVIRSLKKKEYEYTCKNEPMVSHCDVGLCRGRRFGVGGGGNFPIISGMSKLDMEPPVWFVDVGGHRIEATTEQLQNYIKFHALCMERINTCYRSTSQKDWLAQVGAAMESVTVIEAPPDLGNPERFREHLQEYLTNRARGERREDLLMGRPWEDETEHRHYFKLSGLEKYLEREGVKNVTRQEMGKRIEALGGGHKVLRVKETTANVWWVPSSAVESPPELEPATLKREPI